MITNSNLNNIITGISGHPYIRWTFNNPLITALLIISIILFILFLFIEDITNYNYVRIGFYSYICTIIVLYMQNSIMMTKDVDNTRMNSLLNGPSAMRSTTGFAETKLDYQQPQLQPLPPQMPQLQPLPPQMSQLQPLPPQMPQLQPLQVPRKIEFDVPDPSDSSWIN